MNLNTAHKWVEYTEASLHSLNTCYKTAVHSETMLWATGQQFFVYITESSKNWKYSTCGELGHMLMHKLKIHHCVVKAMLWLTRQRLVHHLFSGRNVNSTRHLRAPPPCCSAYYFTLAHYFQESPLLSPFPSVTLSLSFYHLHPSISCRSLSAGLRLLYVRHTWAVASVWKWGSFAFKHSALWALGKLDERRMRGGGGEKEGKWRERGREREATATLRERERERNWRDSERGVKEGVCGEHWLI